MIRSCSAASGASNSINVHADLVNMVQMNAGVMKGMQSTFDAQLSSFQHIHKTGYLGKGGGNGKGGEKKKRGYWTQNGPGGKANTNANANGQAQTAGDNGGARKVQTCRRWKSKRGRRGKANN